MLTESFEGALKHGAVHYPDKPFCAFGRTEEVLTYADLHRRVTDCANALQEVGVQPGIRVAICLSTSPCLLIHLLAVMQVGGLAVPLDDSSHTDAKGELIKNLDPHVIVGSAEQGPSSGEPSVEPGTTWSLRQSARPNSEFNRARLGLFTSGSTALPKCVLLSESNLLAGASFVKDAHVITSSDTGVCCMPLNHINGVVTTVLTPLITGGTVIFFQGVFVGSVLLDLLRKHRATWFSAAPIHYQLLLYPGKAPFGLDACRFARSASAPLSPKVQHQFEEMFGIPIVETMGLTECAGQVFSNPIRPDERKYGSVGRPVGNEVQIVDDHDRPLSNGETGEIRVSGANVMLGYLGDLEETGNVLRGGWLYTGDLGYRDSDGFFHITGRKKLIAIFSGFNISLAAVEQAALRVPYVSDAAAVARTNESFGEVIDLYYTGGGVDLAHEEQEIRQQVIRILPNHLAIRRITRLQSLPRGPSGKLLRYQITDAEARS